MKFKLTDSGCVVTTGTLNSTVTPHGHSIKEAKGYFNGATDYDKPSVIFFGEDGSNTIELKHTKKGFSGSLAAYGRKYGVNLNRVANRRSRWGFTVWVEELSEVNKAV